MTDPAQPWRSWARLVRLRVRLIWPEVVLIEVCVLVAALCRGIDYLGPPAGGTATLSVVERTMPLDAWAAMFIVGGTLGLVGLVGDRWPLTSFGHAVLAAAYAGFAVGAFCEVLGRSPVEGWRTPTDWLLVFAVVHWGYADAALDVWRERRRSG
ncbi:hypothetical protein [Nocardia africana]|uniref:Uncharacterized protein n=1 Tax=Nocardia africana TaxID=134964 RepID=A0A378X179_9NOCA|nr:hypothetical protein [Nocardia africana]MCC3311540.1 hypothetical protein [Nocardia africana]SUA47198.1 Uncharacterised protein [Nocardia africana]